MSLTFPGPTVEIRHLTKGSSETLFDGIFAAGGITLSQVSIMTGLEPYLIQNWIKRGFLTSPKKRLYSREQFARIIILNMLRESLQLDQICDLIQSLDGLCDDELYHRYVDFLADETVDMTNADSVARGAEKVAEACENKDSHAHKQLTRILQVMRYAHAASRFKTFAQEILSTMQ